MENLSDDQWGAARKNISQVIEELRTFEDQELTVMVPLVAVKPLSQ